MNINFIDDIIERLTQLKSDAYDAFGHLNNELLNWKPSPEEWSVAQCIDHIIITNEKYFDEINLIIAGSEKQNAWKNIPFAPKLFGTMLIKSVNEEPSRKQKAPQVFQPRASKIEEDIINRFQLHQDDLIKLADSCRDVNIFEKKVTSPVMKYITYNLKDTFTILTSHEARHINQAKRIIQLEDFPRS